MKGTYVITALLGVAVCVVQAAVEEDVCETMQAALAAQVQMLTGVTDAAQAASVLPELCANLAALAALHGKVPEGELWLFIDNNPDVKQELIEQLQLLSVQLVRLEQAQFYGNGELRSALAPYFTPGAGAH
ncbi:MAG: hypothetical protein Q4F35_03530 [Akkermansia sp.]|nr:hypothetical protein [Akkermansia sp.]